MRAALGLIDLDHTTDLEADRRVILRTARFRELELVDTMTYRRTQPRWVFTMLKAVHRFGAHAVIVPTLGHVAGFEKAVTGVADLVAVGGVRPYLGYGPGHTRPSARQRGGVM